MPYERPVVLITGASRGIGAAVAILAATRGYDVAVTYRSEGEAAERVVAACRAGGANAFACGGDVAEEDEVLRLFDEAEAALDVNVLGALWVAREAARRLSRRNGGSGGSIVNISSVAARLGSPGEYVWYAASKGAIDTLTIGLAKELAADGIRVNAVSPGLTRTEIHDRSTGDPDRVERLRTRIPLARVGEPDEIAEAVLFLMSDAASYITGANLAVSGGR
jgi:NAD(P)-dependent dehydrogenase (short-subunit alcohol dehydrogenase family)